MSITHLQKRFIVIVGSAILLCIILFVVLIPSLHQIDALQNNILREKAELEERYNRRVSSKLVLRKLRELKKDLPNITTRITAKKGDEIDFITELENEAIQHNMEHELRLEPSLETRTKPGSAITKIPLQIGLSGDFLDFISYLKQLENTYYMIEPTVIEINEKTDEATPKITAQIQALTLWSK